MAVDSEDTALGLFSGPDAPEESDLYKCVHCGFCLQACPTYLETGLETESPRGRIALMKAVNEGRIDMTPGVVRHWDLCIQCRACEVACPSGVPYGRLIEATMAEVGRRRRLGLMRRLVSRVALKQLLPRQGRLNLLVSGLRLYQSLGVQWAMRKTGAIKLLPGGSAELDGALPQVSASAFRARGQVVPAQGPRRARVALLAGCVMPLVHGPQMDAVVRVLTRNGCEVVVTEGQVCCGAINTHVGDLETARDLARTNIDAFLSSDVEAVVTASAGCGSRMAEYDHLLRDDWRHAVRARELSGMVVDVNEFLYRLPLDPPRVGLDLSVTYQDSCHLLNAQRVADAPRALLKSIPGVTLRELPNAAICCGAGGTYTITERDLSLRVLRSKMRAVRETGADVVATANPGCVLQLQYGVDEEGLAMHVRYVTDLLDEAYSAESLV